MILPLSFYQREDVVSLAQELLGKWLFTQIDGKRTGGMIVETEAYKGAEDKACHAYNNRRTPRTEPMFREGGIAYIYFCYGMHHLFNVVTNRKETPHAILIRAIIPDTGLETIKERRGHKKNLAGGPGMVCEALSIDLTHNHHPLSQMPLWIEDRDFKPQNILATPRIGVAYAKEDAQLPWRFLVANQS